MTLSISWSAIDMLRAFRETLGDHYAEAIAIFEHAHGVWIKGVEPAPTTPASDEQVQIFIGDEAPSNVETPAIGLALLPGTQWTANRLGNRYEVIERYQISVLVKEDEVKAGTWTEDPPGTWTFDDETENGSSLRGSEWLYTAAHDIACAAAQTIQRYARAEGLTVGIAACVIESVDVGPGYFEEGANNPTLRAANAVVRVTRSTEMVTT